MPTYAQVFTDYDINLGDDSPLEIAVALINWALGLLALIAVCIMLYGGFLWMFSKGEEDKIAKAKLVLRNGLIGLLIILAAWGITAWLINLFADVTGANDDDCVGVCSPTYGGGGGMGDFRVHHVNPTPYQEDVFLCTTVAITFSLPVNEETILLESDDTPNDLIDNGDIEFENFSLYIKGATKDHDESCSNHNECRSGVCTDSKCYGNEVTGSITMFESGYGFSFYSDEDFQMDTTYRAELTPGDAIGGTGIFSLDGEGLSEADPLKGWEFTTGQDTDEIPPQVSFEYDNDDPERLLWLMPKDTEVDVCLYAPIQAVFNESIDPATARTDNVWLYDYQVDMSPRKELTVDAPRLNSKTGITDGALISQSSDILEEFHEYGISLYSGDANNDFNMAIRDMCGNPLDGNFNT
ncbi:MAG: pilin, partial [Patescibacteria group bacterium]